jgi:tetratricopeptide (TPR) repeat protein
MKIIILALSLNFFACKQQHINNPEAIKYNKAAMELYHKSGGNDVKGAIELLNKAINIDSGYFKAYYNKRMFELQLREYNDAISTGKEMIKRWPNNADNYGIVGTTYEMMNDTILGQQYLKQALIRYDKVLDTINAKNKSYRYFAMTKGIILIMLNQNQRGNQVLKELYSKETDTLYKQEYLKYIGKNREQILTNAEGVVNATSNATSANK